MWCPDRTLCRRLRKREGSAETSDWQGVLRPLVGHDLYEVGKALVDLSGLDQRVNQVCKATKAVKRRREKEKADEGGCPGHLKANVARLVWSQASWGKPDREPSPAFVSFWKALKPEQFTKEVQVILVASRLWKPISLGRRRTSCFPNREAKTVSLGNHAE